MLFAVLVVAQVVAVLVVAQVVAVFVVVQVIPRKLFALLFVEVDLLECLELLLPWPKHMDLLFAVP